MLDTLRTLCHKFKYLNTNFMRVELFGGFLNVINLIRVITAPVGISNSSKWNILTNC